MVYEVHDYPPGGDYQRSVDDQHHRDKLASAYRTMRREGKRATARQWFQQCKAAEKAMAATIDKLFYEQVGSSVGGLGKAWNDFWSKP